MGFRRGLFIIHQEYAGRCYDIDLFFQSIKDENGKDFVALIFPDCIETTMIDGKFVELKDLISFLKKWRKNSNIAIKWSTFRYGKFYTRRTKQNYSGKHSKQQTVKLLKSIRHWSFPPAKKDEMGVDQYNVFGPHCLLTGIPKKKGEEGKTI